MHDPRDFQEDVFDRIVAMPELQADREISRKLICFERGNENVYHTPQLISLRRAQIIKLIDSPGYHE